VDGPDSGTGRQWEAVPEPLDPKTGVVHRLHGALQVQRGTCGKI
jgi:hypothetical protein